MAKALTKRDRGARPAPPRSAPQFATPGELDDASLLPKRFDRHVEDTRTSFDLVLEKIERMGRQIDDLGDDIKSLRRGIAKLFADRDRWAKGAKRP